MRDAARRRDDADRAGLRRAADARPTAAPAWVVEVVNGGNKPATAPGRYLGRRLELTGYAGDVPSWRTLPGLLVFTCLGGVPADGERLVVRRCGNYWVGRRGAPPAGPGPITVPGCPCTNTPRNLVMSSSLPASNGQMFQNATLSYRTAPPSLVSVGVWGQVYLSDAYFTDTLTGDQFLYHLYCFQNYYFLTRVYETSAYGSPYRDIVRYQWLIGRPGNTCPNVYPFGPFALTNGNVFAGGDPSCIVTITG